MAKSSATLLAMLLVLSATVEYIPAAAGKEPEAVTDVGGCWAVIKAIPGCVKEVTGAARGGGQFGKIGPACCKAINLVSQDCWPKMFPFFPRVDKFLKRLCKASPTDAGAASLPQTDGQGDADLPTWLTSGIDVAKFTGAAAKLAGHAPAPAPAAAKLAGHEPVPAPAAAKLAGHAPAPASAAAKLAAHEPAPAPAAAKLSGHGPAPAPAAAKLSGHGPAPAPAA